MENWIAKFNRDRKALIDYYENLYKEDNEFIKKKALEYSNGDKEKAKDFVAGYLYSIKNPHTKSIHLIELYVMDYIPHSKYKYIPKDEHIVKCIRDIFRNELYPKELFSKDDSTKFEKE